MIPSVCGVSGKETGKLDRQEIPRQNCAYQVSSPTPPQHRIPRDLGWGCVNTYQPFKPSPMRGLVVSDGTIPCRQDGIQFSAAKLAPACASTCPRHSLNAPAACALHALELFILNASSRASVSPVLEPSALESHIVREISVASLFSVFSLFSVASLFS